MAGKPAAREGDGIICPLPQTTPAALPHAPPPSGRPILLGAPTVLIGEQAAARIGDMSLCTTPVPAGNPIMKGAFPVRIENSPAARVTDPGTHPGSVIAPPCCLTVLIGLAGTSGNPWAGKKQCAAMAAGRNPNPGSKNPSGKPIPPKQPSQSYNNCGVESCRQIINQVTGSNPGQERLLVQAIKDGNATGKPTLYASGGTINRGQVGILARYNIPATPIESSPASIQAAVAQGRGVIVGVDAGTPGFWPSSPMPPGSGHAVLVTGVKYDDNGNVVAYIINDTGIGKCMKEVPGWLFEFAQAIWVAQRGSAPIATKNPIW